MIAIEAKRISDNQYQQVVDWHENEPELETLQADGLLNTFIVSNSICNYKLWHEEDFARRKDVNDSDIARVKRNIDGWNQKRNDFIEKIDEEFISSLQAEITMDKSSRQNSETMGSIMDKLSIINLKIYHMLELVEVYPQNEQYNNKLATLKAQRTDLSKCLDELFRDIKSGKRYIKIYRQMKMYNDPEMNAQLNKDLK